VALLSYLFRRRKLVPQARGSVFLLENFPGTDFLQGSICRLEIPRVGIGRQFEAIDFLDQRTLIIAAERTRIHRAKLFQLRIRRD
jgi:hypothetical protein